MKRCLLTIVFLFLFSGLISAQDFTYTPDTIAPVFDEFHQQFDRRYSYFSIKPEVDWAQLKDEFRPKALAAKNADELAVVIQEMLKPLNDIHVFVMTKNGKRLGTRMRTWNYNGNGNITVAQLTDRVQCGQFAMVGKTKPDGFGYFLMMNQGAANKENVAQAVEAIKKLKDTPGFIVDIRRATGGNEILAMEIAKLFCDKTVTYAKSKYRNGPKHTDFGIPSERRLPATPEAYTKPVVCMFGEGTISSGEGFAKMMKALPHVTTVGVNTAGCSGNPGPLEVGKTGIVVYHSRWVDMLPDGTSLETKGVPPGVEVKVEYESYRKADATLEKGLEVLRKKTKP
jgi:C-terminal processing protease CtpA/Prc